MSAPVLWLPSAQNLEGVDLGARRGAETTPLEAPSRATLHLARSLAPGALSILEEWSARSPDAASVEGPERHIEYDGYFGVRRVADADPLFALHEAAVVAHYQWTRDGLRGQSLSPVEIEHLHGAFEATFSFVAGTSAAESAEPPAWSGPPPEGPVDALLRWKIGHHVFFVLTQALILVHTQLAVALDREDIEVARQALSVGTRLWLGTAAAFSYTGDFSADDYENIVRPSMSPPFLKDGFSGFFSSDHVYLIRALKRLQPLLQRLPPELGPDHRSYLQALDDAYEAHALVCEAFVGTGHSLRGNQRDRQAIGPTFIRKTLKSRTMAAAGHQPEE
jgi:hypothetical protein